MSKKILLLGGSAQQIVAIEKAKDLGYETVLCDYLPDNPGQYVADKYYNASTTDVEAVYEIAKSEGVSGILAYASDPAALPAAIVAERLGLPTNPSASVAVLGVKHEWRKFLQANGFACPKACAFHANQEIALIKSSLGNFGFPIIVKPTDSSGSKGVSMLNNLDDLDKAIRWADCYSRNKILIAEEFIHRDFPYVIGGDIFVWDGKIVLYGELACLRDDNGKGLIPIGKKKPSSLTTSQKEKVYAELQRLITMLGVRFGEMNIEILLDKNNDVHFLEVGPRAGGNMIPLLLSDAYGVDLVKANVLAAMGEDPALDIHEQEGCFMTYVLHSHVDGIFHGVEFSEEVLPYVYRKVLYKKEGDEVEAFDGAGKALGIVFFHIDTEKRMNEFVEKIDDLVRVKVLKGA